MVEPITIDTAVTSVILNLSRMFGSSINQWMNGKFRMGKKKPRKTKKKSVKKRGDIFCCGLIIGIIVIMVLIQLLNQDVMVVLIIV